MITFELTILGTSSALPTSTRYQTAQVLNVRERFFLIDCGEGTQNQIRKYGVKMSRINHILISHMHGDHYFGLLGLISSYVLLGRKTDLHIYSHSELPVILKPQLDLLMAEAGFNLVWHPLNFKKARTIFADSAVKVTAFPLKHRTPCCGFLFEELETELNLKKDVVEQFSIPVKEIHAIKNGSDFAASTGDIIPNSELTLPAYKPRKYAFCTDTLFVPKNAEMLQGVDLLYHEATFDKRFEKRAKETYHSTAAQAAQMALLCQAEKLVIGHFSTRYKNITPLVDEARELFPNTVAANEGDVIQVERKRSDE